MNINRRQFLITTGGVYLATKTNIFGQQKPTVVIAGAGLSGLSTAYELAEKGFDVTIIEARNRLGGRVFTLREPFSDNLYTETGGELIGDGYKRFLKYADKFDIQYNELRTEAETGGSIAELQDGIGRNAYMKGKFYRKGTKIKNYPYNVKAEEKKVLPPTLYGMKLRLMFNELRKKTKTLADFDKLTLAEALRQKGVSQKAIELINISLNYNSINTVSTGGILNDTIKRRSAGTAPLQIVGGNDLIIKAFSNALKSRGVKFAMNSKVKKVTQENNGIKVSFENNKGKIQTIEADKFVCTIPFSVLSDIEFSPALPEKKSKAIKELNYTQSTKVYHQAKYAEWDKRSLGSSVWTDTPIERIFSTTGKSGDERGLFTIWTEGEGSKFLEYMSESKRIDYTRRKFEQVLPFMKGSVEKSHTLSWSQDPFAKGAYAHFTVGQLTSIQPHIATPVGNIHFAGEHTALKSPGMEGALESAERVVGEILKSKKTQTSTTTM